MTTELVTVEEWPPPKGYANGRIGRGAVLHVGGQVGWNERGVFERDDLVGQFERALDNLLVVLRAAHARVDDIAEMTIYVTDIAAYRLARKQLGPIWKARFGGFFPAMTLVAVTALVEPDALVEISATAYVRPEGIPVGEST
jgi:enamine deaminase RidA (YjgF/YER057c/UK114 family)